MILPGAVQATTGLILSYPFDTLKSKLQKYPRYYNSSWDCLVKTLRGDGVRGLYRGIPAPLTIMSIKRGFQYDLYERFNKLNFNPFLTGTIAGCLGTIIGCPMHYIKINMQTNTTLSEKLNINYNTWDFIKYTFKTKGTLEFYKGIKIDCLKEGSFGCLYLGTYGILRDKFPPTPFYYFISGGISSIITWTILFPLDSLRTNIMTNPNNNGIIHNIKLMIKDEPKPISRLWSGLLPVVVRIFPISAISMVTYEYTRKLLE